MKKKNQTANRLLIHVDTELAAKDLLNRRMAYVSISRGASDVQLGRWCERNRNRVYVPEWLLEAWGM
jgi:hypothetical protein